MGLVKDEAAGGELEELWFRSTSENTSGDGYGYGSGGGGGREAV
jgi:hypothetical protein